MKNADWLIEEIRKRSDDAAKHLTCNSCVLSLTDCSDTDVFCNEGIKEWLDQEHDECVQEIDNSYGKRKRGDE